MTLDRLAAEVAVPLAAVGADELAALVAAGLAETWAWRGEPVATLTPLGARRARVRLAECGAGLAYRWLPADEPEPTHSRARSVGVAADVSLVGLVDGRSPDPAVACELAEVVGHAVPADDDGTAGTVIIPPERTGREVRSHLAARRRRKALRSARLARRAPPAA